MEIRRAHAHEHLALSRIARASKAHWGYAEQDLRRWEPELTLTADSVRRRPTFVATRENRLVGFFQLRVHPAVVSLEHFWVLPVCMGQGLGRALLERAAAEAALLDHVTLHIDADPNAEPFYLACGAVRTGAVAAPACGQKSRTRPQLVLATR